MDIKQINSAIMFNTWTDQELRSMIDAVQFARTSLQKRVKRELRLGAWVEWDSVKRGLRGRGVVTKIAQKYITVRAGDTLWRVPAHMLRLVEEQSA
jgi:hypothetical protein